MQTEFHPYSPTIEQLKASVQKMCSDIVQQEKKQEMWEWQKECNAIKRILLDISVIAAGLARRVEELEKPKPQPQPQPHLDCNGNIKGYLHSDGTIRRHSEDE